MNVVPEDPLQPVADAAGSAADAAGQIYKQRMFPVDFDPFFLKLFFQPAGSDSVSQEQRDRIFIIHEVTSRVLIRQASSLGDCPGIIGFILDDFRAFTSEHVLFPLLCISRHMDPDPEAKGGAYDTDGQSQIAC